MIKKMSFALIILYFNLLRAESVLENPNIPYCTPKKIYLTFDDGPRANTTLNIMKILNDNEIKATFFITTSKLEKNSENQNIVRTLHNNGHLIASHGYKHNAYDLRYVNGQEKEAPLTPDEQNWRIERSWDLLNEATRNQFSLLLAQLFRFPYGRGAMPSKSELNLMVQSERITKATKDEYLKESPALRRILNHGFFHLGWNHDSQDATTKYSSNLTGSKINEYVNQNLKNMCSGSMNKVALFHDVKEINVKALDQIIKEGQNLGLTFSSYEEMLEDDSLVNNKVLIKNQTFSNPSQSTNKSSSTSTPQSQPNCQQKQCFSNYTHSYVNHCGGVDTICYCGNWISRVNWRSSATVDQKKECNQW